MWRCALYKLLSLEMSHYHSRIISERHILIYLEHMKLNMYSRLLARSIMKLSYLTEMRLWKMISGFDRIWRGVPWVMRFSMIIFNDKYIIIFTFNRLYSSLLFTLSFVYFLILNLKNSVGFEWWMFQPQHGKRHYLQDDLIFCFLSPGNGWYERANNSTVARRTNFASTNENALNNDWRIRRTWIIHYVI